MKINIRLRLKGKLMLPILGIVIIGISILQISNYNGSSKVLEKEIISAIERDSEGANRSIDQWIVTTVGTLKNWSRNSIFNSALSGSFGSAERVTEFTDNALLDFPVYEGVALVGLDGKVVAASPASYASLDVSDRGYFKTALNGETGLSEPIISRATGNPIFVISFPVADEYGTVKGVLFAVVSVSHLYDLILLHK